MKLNKTVLSVMLLTAMAGRGLSQDVPARALENVVIHLADGNTIRSGTIVWRNSIIKSIGADVTPPFDAFVIDGGDSLHVYPGFIDGLALWGSPDLPEEHTQPERPGDPGYERAGIQPQRRPADLLDYGDDALEQARKLGFTTAAIGLRGYMLPGQLDLFFINGEKTDEYLYREGIALHAQFEEAPGGWGNGAYPATLMGVMAQFRQLWFDAVALKTQAEYYASKSQDYPAPKKNDVLEALNPVIQNEQPLYFVVDTGENIERLLWLQDEFGFEVVIVSGKEAYLKSDELKRRNIPVLAGIELPEKPVWKVKEEEGAGDEIEEVTDEMRIFREKQLAAYKASIQNLARLLESGVRVGYASNGMKLKEFRKHISLLYKETSMNETQILRMLTQSTAEILGSGNRLGDLKIGRIASFSVFTRPFTEEEARVKYSVSNGVLKEFDLAETASTGNNEEGKKTGGKR